MFSAKDVPPQETSQRRAERRAECTVVDAEGHGVHCCPECPIGDGKPVDEMDLLPCLYYAGEKDGGTNIRTCKLVIDITGQLIMFNTYPPYTTGYRNSRCTGSRRGKPCHQYYPRFLSC